MPWALIVRGALDVDPVTVSVASAPVLLLSLSSVGHAASASCG